MLEKALGFVIGVGVGLILHYIIKAIKWFISNRTRWGKEKIKQANKKNFSDVIEDLRRAFK